MSKVIAYKCLFERNDGTLESYAATVGKAGIIYKEGIVNLPVIPNSGLFCFKTLKDAKRFDSECIFEVEIEPLEKELTEVTSLTLESISMFWADGRVVYPNPVPEGTILAKSVVLLRRIS